MFSIAVIYINNVGILMLSHLEQTKHAQDVLLEYFRPHENANKLLVSISDKHNYDLPQCNSS